MSTPDQHTPQRPSMRHLDRWHGAINRHILEVGYSDETRFMYEAKKAADEVPRLAYLFAKERSGGLAQTHRQCSHSAPEPVEDNHLACCLGVKCRECPFLLAIDTADLSDEEKDQSKAWTCATHIVSKGGDVANEGYVLTVDDRMFWSRVYESLSGGYS